MNEELTRLSKWFKAMHKAQGRGGGKYLADALDLPSSTITKLANGKTNFDLKTIRTIALLQTSKDEQYNKSSLNWEYAEDGFIIRGRQVGKKEIVTWTLKK